MTRIRYTIVLVLIVGSMITLSGCKVSDPAWNGSITFDGEMREENGTFVLNGSLVNSGVKNLSGGDLYIYLYHKNGTRIETISAGTFRRETPISLRRDVVPFYVIFDSPRFWNTPKVGVDYYRRARSGNHYVPDPVGNRYEFPVTLPDQGEDDHGPGTGSGANRPSSTLKK